MHRSIPIFLSSLTLNLLAISTTANGYPIRTLTSNITNTHIPFPTFLVPSSVSASASALTNGKAPATVAAATTFTNVIERSDDTDTAKLSLSPADEGRQVEKKVHAAENDRHGGVRAEAKAEAETHNVSAWRRDWFFSKIEKWGLVAWDKVLEVLGLDGPHPGGGRSRPPQTGEEVQTRRGVVDGAEVGEERDGTMRGRVVVRARQNESEDENESERRMYGEGCIWGEVVDC